eukprot:scaffold270258_cov67-Attheya_sp.AAC.1
MAEFLGSRSVGPFSSIAIGVLAARDFIVKYQILHTYDNTTAEAAIYTKLSKDDAGGVYQTHRGVIICDTGFVDTAAAD